MRRRVSSLVLVAAWVAGPVLGADCLWRCPPEAPAMAESGAHCHEDTADPATATIGTMHDCGDHQEIATPATVHGRRDFHAAPARFVVQTAAHAGAPAPDQTTAETQTSPPVRFLIPLRQ